MRINEYLHPMSMVLPGIVGFKLSGKLKNGVTGTDLVLTVTEMLWKHGVVGKFMEFYGKEMKVLRTDSEGKCSCMFNLLWQHDPLDKKKTVASIDNICLIQSRDPLVDPILDSFIDLARSKVEARNSEVGKFPRSLSQGKESKKCDNVSPGTKVATCTIGNTESFGYEPMDFQPSICRLAEMTPTTGGIHTFGRVSLS